MTVSVQDRSELATTGSAPAGEKTWSPAAKFHSVLFDQPRPRQLSTEAPAFFRDLNLDQIVNAVTAGRDDYNLTPFFYTSSTDLVTIEYRHAIFRDLEDEKLFQSIKSFSAQLQRMRGDLATARKVSYKYEKERWFLDGVEIYCAAIEELLANLNKCELKSRGLLSFRSHLAEYARSRSFKALAGDTRKLKADLAAIRYCLLINGGSVTVRHYHSEIDYTAAVEDTFARFKQSAAKDHRVKLKTLAELNHVEAQILDLVAQLNPEVFGALDDYCQRHNNNYLTDVIAEFDREIQFYIAWLEHAVIFKRAGLSFCYPQLSRTDKQVSSREGFDLALAGKLIAEKSVVVCNDFYLAGKERLFVVTGPNQGGKTTFARTFGQLHYFARLGCPIPGSEARLFLFDHLFTHFEREEDITTLQGKLQDDLVAIHGVLSRATSDSIIIINELFSATAVKDSLFLTERILQRISKLDSLCVCVTFLDELASLDEKTVSVVAQIVPEDPTRRTFKLERKPADGLAYAVAIAKKYQLTYDQLKERLGKS